MNHLKYNLDGIAGDFKEEKARLVRGIEQKLIKKSKRKTLKVSVVASLVAALLCVVVYQFSTRPTYTTAYSSEQPVYFDEKVFNYFALTSVSDDGQKQNFEAFQLMVFQVAMEHYLRSADLYYTEDTYEILLDYFLKNELERFEYNEQYKNKIEIFAKEAKVSIEDYIKTYIAPAHAKIYAMDWVIGMNPPIDETTIITEFLNNYKEEIEALAEQLDIPFQVEDVIYSFAGRIVEKDGNQVLVVNAATSEDIWTMEPLDIVEKYNSVIWFTLDEDINYLFVGDFVEVKYKAKTDLLPSYTEALSIQRITQAINPPVYYDENLYNYCKATLYELDEEMRAHDAFLTMIWNMGIQNYANEIGFYLNEEKFQQEVQAIKETVVNENQSNDYYIQASKLMNLSVNEFLDQYEIPIRAKHNLITEFLEEQGITDVWKEILPNYEQENEKEIRELAEKLQVPYEPTIFEESNE